jgi:hypothetical protein
MNQLWSGTQAYLKSVAELLSQPELSRWYLRSLGWTLFFAGLCLFGLVVGGATFWLSFFGVSWAGAFATLLWLLVALLVSGQVAKAIVFATIFLFSSEEKLLRAYFGSGFPAHTNTWTIVFREFGFLILSLFVGVLSALFLLFGLTFPLGILLTAWIYGLEVTRSGRRLLVLNGLSARELSHRRALGVGLIPAVLSVIPILGWACLPVLLIAGIKAQHDSKTLSF